MLFDNLEVAPGFEKAGDPWTIVRKLQMIYKYTQRMIDIYDHEDIYDCLSGYKQSYYIIMIEM